MVIIVTGFSFAGYVANRLFGARRGTGLLYTPDAADELLRVDRGGRRLITKNKNKTTSVSYSHANFRRQSRHI